MLERCSYPQEDRGAGKTKESFVADNVSLYLQEVAPRGLLSADEEVELGRKVQKGLKATSALSTVLAICPQEISIENLTALLNISSCVFKARDNLVESNLKLVVTLAKKKMGNGLDVGDLIQAGNLGLFKAIEKFDPERGFRFTTYAYHWIKQGISRALENHGRTRRIPVHRGDLLGQAYKAIGELEQELGRRPTNKELADSLHVSIQTLISLFFNCQPDLSLDESLKIEEDDNLTRGDLLASTEPSVEDQARVTFLKDQVTEVLDFLPERERKVLQLRFGLDGSESRTLEEVGKEMGVTRERIRQIESEALRTLRKSLAGKKLKLENFL